MSSRIPRGSTPAQNGNPYAYCPPPAPPPRPPFVPVFPPPPIHFPPPPPPQPINIINNGGGGDSVTDYKQDVSISELSSQIQLINRTVEALSSMETLDSISSLLSSYYTRQEAVEHILAFQDLSGEVTTKVNSEQVSGIVSGMLNADQEDLLDLLDRVNDLNSQINN